MSVQFKEFDISRVPSDAKRLKYASITDVFPSAGLATFINNSNGHISVTVWYGNGANGYSNAVIPAGEYWSLHVQGGDTFSWAYGNNGVPESNTRYWINYGDNHLPF